MEDGPWPPINMDPRTPDRRQAVRLRVQHRHKASTTSACMLFAGLFFVVQDELALQQILVRKSEILSTAASVVCPGRP